MQYVRIGDSYIWHVLKIISDNGKVDERWVGTKRTYCGIWLEGEYIPKRELEIADEPPSVLYKRCMSNGCKQRFHDEA